MFSRTGFSNLLNKIQFTFEVVPCLISGLFRRFFRRSRVGFQADNAQLVRSTGANVSVILLQGPKYSPQKSRPLESGHRRHGVCIAIECSYKLDQKNEFKFLCELCTFSQIRSHINTVPVNSVKILTMQSVENLKIFKFACLPACQH